MKIRKLRQIEVSEIGMGCMGFSHGYGNAPEREYSIRAIEEAYDYGCTFFDTAETYGTQQFYPGHNEKLVGEAILPFRKKVVLATKFHFRNETPTKREEIDKVIRRHLKQSLKNLQTDYVDLYYLHRINEEVPLEEVAHVMGDLIREGVIRGWGFHRCPGRRCAGRI